MMRINLQLFLLALLCAFSISCGGSTTTIMDEGITTVVEETTAPETGSAGDGEPVTLTVLQLMSVLGERGGFMDTALRLKGQDIVDGHREVLGSNDSLEPHVTVSIWVDTDPDGPATQVTDATVDDQALCTATATLANEDPVSLDLVAGEVLYVADLRPYQQDYELAEVQLTITGQVDPKLAVIDFADSVNLQPTTTITTTTREWRREEIKKDDGFNVGAFGLLGLLGLAMGNTPAGACVQLVCGGAGFDPVDADTIVFVVPPKYDTESEPESEPDENVPPTVNLSAVPASGKAPLSVGFIAIAHDSDGTIRGYSWDLGDDHWWAGTSSAIQTYHQPGQYVITVKVWDNDGATATDSVTITVTEPVDPVDPVDYELFIAGIEGPLVDGATWQVDETGSQVFNIIEWHGSDSSKVSLSPSSIRFDSDLPNWCWNTNGELMTVLYAEPLDPDLDDPGNMFINPGSYAVQFSATHQNGDTDVINFTLNVLDRADWPPA